MFVVLCVNLIDRNTAGVDLSSVRYTTIFSDQAATAKFSVVLDNPKHFSGKLGPMTIAVKQGDITKERVDAIVNSTDAGFRQKGVCF